MLTGTGIPPAVCHGPCLQTPWMSFMNRHIPQCECHNAVEDLSLHPGLKEKAYFQEALRERGQASEECKQLKVIESHGDQVQYLNFLRSAELSVWLLTQDGVTTMQPWYVCQDHIIAVMNSHALWHARSGLAALNVQEHAYSRSLNCLRAQSRWRAPRQPQMRSGRTRTGCWPFRATQRWPRRRPCRRSGPSCPPMGACPPYGDAVILQRLAEQSPQCTVGCYV